MRVAYADPPYPGCAHLYRDHPDYAGEVDHEALVASLLADFVDLYPGTGAVTRAWETWRREVAA